MKPGTPDKDVDHVALATRFMQSEVNTIERHFKLKDLSHESARVLLLASARECMGLFPVTVTTQFGKRGKATFDVR